MQFNERKRRRREESVDPSELYDTPDPHYELDMDRVEIKLMIETYLSGYPESRRNAFVNHYVYEYPIDDWQIF